DLAGVLDGDADGARARLAALGPVVGGGRRRTAEPQQQCRGSRDGGPEPPVCHLHVPVPLCCVGFPVLAGRHHAVVTCRRKGFDGGYGVVLRDFNARGVPPSGPWRCRPGWRMMWTDGG